MQPSLQRAAGLGLKPQHFAEALACTDAGLFFEVHPENCMVDGGPRLAWLERIRARHPLSLHGVALSLAADAPPDPVHLARLAAVVRRLQPALVSEHLAWSTWRGTYRPDLLPVPRTRAVLQRVVDNIDRVQQALGRTIALEHPAHYVAWPAHAIEEPQFLAEIARRSGCRLLVDVNNVWVGAHNCGFDPAAWLDALAGLAGDAIAEIHLAGHRVDPAGHLLIDSHDAPVADAVWALYERLVARIGARPTLIERDAEVPAFDTLRAERAQAWAMLERLPAAGNVPGAEPVASPSPHLASPAAHGSASPALPATYAGLIDAIDRVLRPAAPAPASPAAGPGPGPDADPDVAALVADPAFAVYRNTVATGCIDALVANFPALARLMGDDWLRGAAAAFVAAHLPASPMLLAYGDRFVDFLATFPPAAEWPYLPAVARLDRLWSEAHGAADADALAPRAFAELAGERATEARLRPHPAARWRFDAEWPAYTLWTHSRQEPPPAEPPKTTWTGEGVLLTRPQRDGAVQWRPLGRGGCALLDACARGLPLGLALAEAIEAEPDLAPVPLLLDLASAGAFAPLPDDPIAAAAAPATGAVAHDLVD